MKKRTIFSPMLKEVISNLFKKPATSKYPFIKCEVPEGFRGKQVFDITLCISCGLCSRDCPSKAIEMVEVNGKKRPMFHLDQCIFCYQCAEGCPKNAIKATTIFELATTCKSDLVLKPELNPPEKTGAKQ